MVKSFVFRCFQIFTDKCDHMATLQLLHREHWAATIAIWYLSHDAESLSLTSLALWSLAFRSLAFWSIAFLSIALWFIAFLVNALQSISFFITLVSWPFKWPHWRSFWRDIWFPYPGLMTVTLKAPRIIFQQSWAEVSYPIDLFSHDWNKSFWCSVIQKITIKWFSSFYIIKRYYFSNYLHCGEIR